MNANIVSIGNTTAKVNNKALSGNTTAKVNNKALSGNTTAKVNNKALSGNTTAKVNNKAISGNTTAKVNNKAISGNTTVKVNSKNTVKVKSKAYHLEVLEVPYCNNENLIIFSRAHMTYINQIFGDESIRDIIQEVFPMGGKLVIEPADENFEYSVHHVYYADDDEEPDHELTLEEEEARPADFVTTKVCSVTNGYQDLEADENDTLCQSYSLMAFLEVEFDNTPSKDATRAQKYEKHKAMIKMYRDILDFPDFYWKLSAIIRDSHNKKLWKDTVDEDHPFFINQRFKTVEKVVATIKRVLNIWEQYGWHYFVENGKCPKEKQDGGRTRKNKSKNHV